MRRAKQVVLPLGTPSPKQRLFFADDHFIVGFGGARGGGKSWALQIKAVMMAVNFAGINIMMVRRTYRELVNNHIERLRTLLREVATYNATDKCFRFFNGSRIMFAYCNADRDLQNFQGIEFHILMIDEATQLREEWIQKLIPSVRATDSYPRRVYMTCNPGGPSHAYFRRIFIDKRYKAGEDPSNYSFIQSLVTDNLALMASQPEYKKQLEALPPALRKAWLEGRWDIFEGAYFEEFRAEPDPQMCHDAGITPEEALEQHRYTHVIPPFDLNRGACRSWPIMRSYDFGYGKPFSFGYWTMDESGTLYRIAEIYGCTETPNEGVKWSPDEQFAKAAEFEQSHPWFKGRKITGIADPSIWDKSRGDSIADTAAKHGIYFVPGDNHRVAGWMQVHTRMRFDADGYAKIYFFDCCKAAIRTVPMMMFSATKPEDLDTSLEDHACDDIRYMCMSHQIAPIVPEETPEIFSDPLNQFGDGKRRRFY